MRSRSRLYNILKDVNIKRSFISSLFGKIYPLLIKYEKKLHQGFMSLCYSTMIFEKKVNDQGIQEEGGYSRKDGKLSTRYRPPLYLGKFVGHALHDLHALTARHCLSYSSNLLNSST